MNTTQKHSVFNIAVIVAALGYFVDIYDLLLFTIVREPSLHGLKVSRCRHDRRQYQDH